MAAHAKFLFETEFGEPSEAAARVKPAFTADDLAAARAAAHAEGVQEGRRQALAEAAAGTDQSVAQLLEQVRALTGNLAKERDLLAAEAMELARVCAELLADTLISHQPQAELLALFEECIGHLSGAPHLAVRVPATNVEDLRAVLTRIAETKGYDGRIIVLSEADMAPGDCRIEWADGGIARDSGKLRATLRRLIASRLPPEFQLTPDDDIAETPDGTPRGAAPQGE